MLLTLSAAAALFAGGAQAQASQAAQTHASSGASAQTPAPAPAPRYAASDLERAFSYMDRSGDARISREEAAAFRGVAKNFDRADTDLDGFLSREEFDTAMNYVKPQ